MPDAGMVTVMATNVVVVNVVVIMAGVATQYRYGNAAIQQ